MATHTDIIIFTNINGMEKNLITFRLVHGKKRNYPDFKLCIPKIEMILPNLISEFSQIGFTTRCNAVGGQHRTAKINLQ